MNIRYPIYEGVYRILTFQHGDPGLFRLVECHKYGCLVLEFLAKEKE